MRGHGRGGTALFLGLIALVQFATMPRHLYSGDPMSVQIAAASLLIDGRLDVPSAIARTFGQGERGQYFFENVKTGKWYTKYGLFNTLMFVPPLLAEMLARGELRHVPAGAARVFCCNLYNVALSLGIAAYLLRLAWLFAARRSHGFAYVAAAFYATYLWNYLRAQTFEIWQLLFFLGWLHHLFVFRRLRAAGGFSRGHLLSSVLHLCALCMSKLFFAPLLPLMCGLLALDAWRGRAGGAGAGGRGGGPARLAVEAAARWREYALCAALPAAAALAVVLCANSAMFGSPFETGYRQWVKAERLFGGDAAAGSRLLLFSPQRSVFLYFPPLALALAGAAGFARKHRSEAAFIAAVFAVQFALLSKFFDAGGSWSYGPRYLVFVLPAAALPALEAAAWAGARLGRLLAAGAAVAPALLVSAYLQVCVNALEFHAYYRFRLVLEQAGVAGAEPVRRYFEVRHMGQVARDLSRMKAGRPMPALEAARPLLAPGAFAALREQAAGACEGNYFFGGRRLSPRGSKAAVVSACVARGHADSIRVIGQTACLAWCRRVSQGRSDDHAQIVRRGGFRAGGGPCGLPVHGCRG